MTLGIPQQERAQCLKLAWEHPSSRPITRISSRVPPPKTATLTFRRAGFRRWTSAGISRIFAQSRLAPISITRCSTPFPPASPSQPLKFANRNDNPNPRHSKARHNQPARRGRKEKKKSFRQKLERGNHRSIRSGRKRTKQEDCLPSFIYLFSSLVTLWLITVPVFLLESCQLAGRSDRCQWVPVVPPRRFKHDSDTIEDFLILNRELGNGLWC